MSKETHIALHQPTLAKIAQDNVFSGIGYKVLMYLMAASSDTHDIRQVTDEMDMPEPSIRKAIEQLKSAHLVTMRTSTVFHFSMDNYLPEVPGKKKLVLSEEDEKSLY